MYDRNFLRKCFMSDILSDQKDANMLEKIQGARERIMDAMLKDGIPKCKEDREFLMQAMNASTSTILSKAKIKSDATAAQSQAATAKAIAEALLRYKPGKRDDSSNNLPELDVANFNTNPGETDIGALPVTYNEIMNS